MECPKEYLRQSPGLTPTLSPKAVEPLCESSFLFECGCLSRDLTVEQRTRYLDKDQGRIGGRASVGG